MFFFRKKYIDEPAEKVEIVSCDECKCLVEKEQAQKVLAPFGQEYFCKAHRKPYTRKAFSFFHGRYVYFKELVVDESGEPVGYRKIDENPVAKPTKK